MTLVLPLVCLTVLRRKCQADCHTRTFVVITYRASSHTSCHHTLILGLLVAAQPQVYDQRLTEYYQMSVVRTLKIIERPEAHH
jgi:hypothetical protein